MKPSAVGTTVSCTPGTVNHAYATLMDEGLVITAAAYGLEFVALAQEQYDLAIPEDVWESRLAHLLVEVIRSARSREAVSTVEGYDTAISGCKCWVG